MAYEIMPDPARAAREGFAGPASGEGLAEPAGEVRDGFPASPRAARRAFPGPARAARKGVTNPVRAAREGFAGPRGAGGEVSPGPADAAREGFAGPAGGEGLAESAGEAREGFPASPRAARKASTGPARAARRGGTNTAGAARRSLTDLARAAREGLSGSRAAREGLADPAGATREGLAGPAGRSFPAPPRAAREAFRGQPGDGREVFPDPVALAGAVGESFTEPGGPATAPPPPAGAESRDPAGGTAEAAAGVGRSLPIATVAPAHRSEGSRSAARRSARSGRRAARRVARRRNLTVGILTVSGLVVLPLVLWSTGDSGDSAPAGADRAAGEAPDPDAGERNTDPSRTGAGDARQGALHGRLHNVASDLCVGVDGDKAVEGAEAELTTCSAEAAQQWTYETDGLLRNGAAPDLCLDSQLGYSVRLAPCTGASRPDPKNIRYDFTLQGALVPRWDQDLALAPAATDGSGALVLKARTDDEVQRWVIDTSRADLQVQAVNWNANVPATRTAPAPSPGPTRSRTPAPTPTPSPASPAPEQTPSSPAATDPSCYRYHCDSDGRYGNPDQGYPGHGYGRGGDGRR
ncbi:ricin-type beta-trefoil lectin domain protein [Streptomyces sp. NRRL B-1140]|uniref:ricin-type beta-trefoil lectin domain protein n=1 Tax=Streptomyces sp. NRRL B-1140 TaxID=1415549 RepID=UPI002D21E444|nr:ricin-type beta-trefoil lectin domain protein [Streptomyces sp. NRRL B-1140]